MSLVTMETSMKVPLKLELEPLCGLPISSWVCIQDQWSHHPKEIPTSHVYCNTVANTQAIESAELWYMDKENLVYTQ